MRALVLCLALVEVAWGGALPPRARVLQWMDEGDVPGLSIAVVRGGKLQPPVSYGVRNSNTSQPVDSHTVFEAASLTKPVFAYAVLQLVDQGKFDLDRPLIEWVPDYIKDDPRSAKVTARHVLSHSTGFPNWARGGMPLKTTFEPGSQFSYSGEGYIYLSKAVEKASGKSLNEVMETLVFQPLGMSSSGLVWRPAFDNVSAVGHDSARNTSGKFKPEQPNAAASLHTTAEDYGRFLAAVMNGKGLKPATAQQMFHPQNPVAKRCAECVGREAAAFSGIAWGLGWGIETASGVFFHWGDNGNFKAWVAGDAARKSAVVMFANGTTGLSVAEDVISSVLPGQHAMFAWLDYERHDSARRIFLHAALAGKPVKPETLAPDDLRGTASDMMARGQLKPALAMLRAAVVQRPDAAPLRSGLAEAWLLNGNREAAALELRELLELEPQSRCGAETLKLIERGLPPYPESSGNVTFLLKGQPKAARVSVAGTFNAWNDRQLRMERNGDDWGVTVTMPPGKYLYRFVVDGEWITDLANPLKESGPRGGNSVLEVK